MNNCSAKKYFVNSIKGCDFFSNQKKNIFINKVLYRIFEFECKMGINFECARASHHNTFCIHNIPTYTFIIIHNTLPVYFIYLSLFNKYINHVLFV